MSSSIFRALGLSTFLLAAGCGGGGGGGGGGDTGSGPDLAAQVDAACEQLQWDTGTVAPLDGVTVSGLEGPILTTATATPRGLYAELLNEGGDVHSVLPVAAGSDGSGNPALSLTAPADPDNLFQGGEVDVRLVVGEERCDPVTLTVDALPDPSDPAATVSDSIVQLKELIANSAASFGYTDYASVVAARDDLVNNATASDLGVPGQLLPLLLAVDTVEILEGIDASSDFTASDRRLFAALLESVGDAGFVNEADFFNLSFSSIGTTSLPTTADHGRLLTRVSAMTSGPSGACAQTISGGAISITSAPELDQRMREQREAERSLSPTESLQGFTIGAAEGVLPVAGVVSPGAAAAAGAFVYLVKLIELYNINTLPSEFVELEPTLYPGASINEDYEQAGGDARWAELMATAESKGMDLAGPTIEGLQTLLGGLGWASSAQSSILENAYDFGQSQLTDVPESQAWAALEAIAQASDCFELAPVTYGPIDITSDYYATAQVDSGTALSLATGSSGLNQTDIQLVHTGEANITIQTRDDRFGGRSDSWSERLIVQQIRLEPDPSFVFAETLGGTESFRIYPRYAEDPAAVNVQAATLSGGGSVAFGPDYDGIQDYILDYTTPTSENEYPVIIELTGTGALPAGGPAGTTERTAQIEISRDAEVLLEPGGACVDPGETVDLTAQIRGASSPNFTWSITAGTGSLAGAQPGNDVTVETNTYQAPSGNTQAVVEVTHTSSNGDTTSDTADIRVGDCDSGTVVTGHLIAAARVTSIATDDSGISERYNSDDDAVDLPNIPLPPDLPASFWVNRSETFSSNGLTVSGTTFGIAQTATAGATSVYDVDGAGTASFSFEYNGARSCVQDPQSTDTRIACTNSTSSSPWDGAIYATIESAGTYELSITYECTQTGGAVGMAFLQMRGYRFIDGTDQDTLNGVATDPPTAGNIYPTYPDAGLIGTGGSDNPFGQQPSTNACNFGQAYTYTRTYELRGPLGKEPFDRIIWNFDTWNLTDVVHNSSIGNYTEAQSTESDGSYTYPKQVGSYQGQVIINGEISFRRVD